MHEEINDLSIYLSVWHLYVTYVGGTNWVHVEAACACFAMRPHGYVPKNPSLCFGPPTVKKEGIFSVVRRFRLFE